MSIPQATNKQIPDHSIVDFFQKQNYLGNQFSLSIPGINLGNTNETPIALIKNPALSSGVAFPNQQALFLNWKRFSSSLQAVLFKIYSAPVVTGTTTAAVPVALRLSSPTISIASCFINGQFTVSGNGTLITTIGCPSGYQPSTDSSMLMIIDPAQSILITATALVSTTVVNSDLVWFEL